MRSLLFSLVVLLVSTSQAQAQQSTEPLDPVETAAAICIGPGVELDDPFEGLRGLPQKNCVKACNAGLKGCLAVAKAINKCGVVLLKGSGKVAAPICQGQGGTKAECKGIKSIVRSEIDAWLNSNDVIFLQCFADTVDCFEVCL